MMDKYLASTLFVFVFAIFFTGCEDTVSPLIGEERPYTIFGYLDPTTSSQVIRVIPIAETIQEVDLVEVNAEVRTTHQETGEVIIWQRSPVLFADSSSGVVFRATFTPEYEATYRLEVENENGEIASAVTTVPAEVNISSLTTGNQFRPGIFIEGDFPNMVQAAIDYEAIALQPAISSQEDVTLPVLVSYKGEQDRSEGGWEIRTDLRDDFEIVREELEGICITTPFFTVRSAAFRSFVGDEAWVPPGDAVEFDPNVLVQPGTFSNIENGFGFFGSGYAIDFSIRLTSSTLEQIGYNAQKPCQPGPGFDDTAPECQDLVPCFD